MSGASNRLRVIGGDWRGRRLDFPSVAGLRPTGDRLRETVFNWLQWAVPGSRCLDLFAGSGALGIEAASRGARAVVLVESSPVVAENLKKTVAGLVTEKIQIHHEKAEVYLQRPAEPFDIVFLDPPFACGMLEPALTRLVQGGWLQKQAYVYLEHEAGAPPPALPAGFSLYRSQRTGQAVGLLVRSDYDDPSVVD